MLPSGRSSTSISPSAPSPLCKENVQERPNPSDAKLRLRAGWLLCNVDASVPGGAKGTLQLVYFLGRDGQPIAEADTKTRGGVGSAAAARLSAHAHHAGTVLPRGQFTLLAPA